jgi:hypothetical protein
VTVYKFDVGRNSGIALDFGRFHAPRREAGITDCEQTPSMPSNDH